MWASFFDELEKIAAEDKKDDDRVMRTAVSARPWVTSAAKGALPTASLAALLPVNPNISAASRLSDAAARQAAISEAQVGAMKKKSKLIALAAGLGTAAGLTDKYMKDWAAKHPRAAATKKLEGQLHREKGDFKKMGAMAGDLRRHGIGGVREPPFPTEDSKQKAEQQLESSSKPGKFATHTQPKHLVRPGPSIRQTAAVPR